MLETWRESSIDLNTWIQYLQNNANNLSIFTKVDALPCLLQYTELFGNRSDVLFVTSTNSTTNNSLFAYGVSGSEDLWKTGWYLGLGNVFDSTLLGLSNFPGGAAERAEKVSNWSIAGQKIDYCLSRQISTHDLCSVEYSLSIMIGEDTLLLTLLRSRSNMRISHMRLQLRQAWLYYIYDNPL